MARPRNVGHEVLLSTTDGDVCELVVRASARHWLVRGNTVEGVEVVNTASATKELMGPYCTTPSLRLPAVPSATGR